MQQMTASALARQHAKLQLMGSPARLPTWGAVLSYLRTPSLLAEAPVKVSRLTLKNRNKCAGLCKIESSRSHGTDSTGLQGWR